MQSIIPAAHTAFPDLVMSDDLRTGLAMLHRATNHFIVLAHRYEMYRAIARNRDFVMRINGTTSAAGLNTLRGALAATLVISLAALFDSEKGATSLYKVLNPVFIPSNAEALATIHHLILVPFDPDQVLDQLRRLRSRLSRPPIKGAVERLRDLRNQDVAHLDLTPEFPNGPALTGEIDLVYAISANIIVKCNLFYGLRIRAADIRAEARAQAHVLSQAIRPSQM
jgi:hypothetical protein